MYLRTVQKKKIQFKHFRRNFSYNLNKLKTEMNNWLSKKISEISSVTTQQKKKDKLCTFTV